MKKHVVHLVGGGLALVALVVYLVTLSAGAAPGASSGYLLSILDQYPRLLPLSSFWFASMQALHFMGGSAAVAAMNVASALCGAIAVWLLYDLMRVGVPAWMDIYQFSEPRRRWIGVFAGAVSAVALAFCLPFWSVANRAHMATFDVLLLLVAARLLVASITQEKFLYLAILTLLYGFFAAEFSTMFVIAPMFAVGGLYALWRQGALQPWRIAILCGLLALGLLVAYPLAALGFYGSPGYVLRDMDGFWHLLWQIWRHQALLLSRSLPREGWLIILVTTTIPWLVMFTVARRGLNEERDGGLLLLHVIMTALVAGILLNMPLSPWAMLGWQRMLVTPYVLTAMVAGYLAAFWLIAAGRWEAARESGIRSLLRFTLSTVLSVGVALVVLIAPWRHASDVGPHRVEEIALAADTVLDSLDGQGWLVSDGQLDAQLLIRAWERDMPLQVINLAAGEQSLYLRYVAEMFEETRLQNAAMLSLSALLREWLQDEDAAAELAILHEPSLWRRFGYTPLPQGMVYVGLKRDAAPDADRLASRQLALLAQMEEMREAFDAAPGDHPVRDWTLRHAGRLANDAAVLLEDFGHNALAARLYRRVRDVDPDNVSALLNLSAMVKTGRTEDPDGDIAAALESLASSLTERYRIWSLSRTYGMVRAPEAFAQMGWTWAYSGQPGLAAEQMDRAVSLAGDRAGSGVDAMRAQVYLLDNRPRQSALLYRGMLEDPERRLTGLMGLYRLAIQQGNVQTAQEYLMRAKESGLPPDTVVLESAVLDLLRKDSAAAIERLEPLLTEQRDLLRGWVLLAEAGFAQQDERLVNRALRRIEMVEGARGYYGSLLRARQAFAAMDAGKAAEFYEAALAQRPGHLPILVELLRLNLLLQRRSPAQRYMKKILAQEPENALALYVRGSLQMEAGDYRLAEDSLRRSLQSKRLPMALNDLSWLLLQRESWEEAEALAQEALAMDANQPTVWDTLGVLYRRTGRMEQAEEAFSRALALDPGNVLTHLHLGELQIQTGNTEAVQELVQRLEPHRDRLSEAQREIWQRLREAIR